MRPRGWRPQRSNILLRSECRGSTLVTFKANWPGYRSLAKPSFTSRASVVLVRPSIMRLEREDRSRRYFVCVLIRIKECCQ
jgi:hypothetical protein